MISYDWHKGLLFVWNKRKKKPRPCCLDRVTLSSDKGSKMYWSCVCFYLNKWLSTQAEPHGAEVLLSLPSGHTPCAPRRIQQQKWQMRVVFIWGVEEMGASRPKRWKSRLLRASCAFWTSSSLSLSGKV